MLKILAIGWCWYTAKVKEEVVKTNAFYQTKVNNLTANLSIGMAREGEQETEMVANE